MTKPSRTVTVHLPLPEVGQRIVLSRIYQDDICWIDAGKSGIVTESEPNTIVVKMDDDFNSLEGDNCIAFYDIEISCRNQPDEQGGNSGQFQNGFFFPPVLEFHWFCSYVE